MARSTMMRSVIGMCLVVTAMLAGGCDGAGEEASSSESNGGGDGDGGGAGGAGGADASSGEAGGPGGIALDAGNGSSDGAAGEDACGSFALNGTTTPGNVIVVFDQSDSMNGPFSEQDAGAGKQKYIAASDSLLAAIDPIKDKLNLGAIFFPTAPPSLAAFCGKVEPITSSPPQIGVEPAATFMTDWQNHFGSGFQLILGTPLQDALDRANAAYPDPSPLTGERVVVVITDGAPTCKVVQAQILAPVQAMFARGIKTYVVGLPGSAKGATLLDAIAKAGGTQKYLSPADPKQLENELSQIASSAIDQCTFTFDPPPPDPHQVHLVATDAAHPDGYEIFGSDGGTESWTLSPDGETATLLGATCDAAKNGSFATLEFVFGCVSGPR